jgi:hypothetical protein
MYLISATSGRKIAILLDLFLDSTLSDQVVVQRDGDANAMVPGGSGW